MTPDALCPAARTVGQKVPVQLVFTGFISAPGGGHPALETLDEVKVAVCEVLVLVENDVVLADPL
jgi:hypothetical protein